MTRASLFSACWLVAGVAFLPACSDDGDDGPGPGPEVPEEAAIRAAFEAWRPALLKECSIQAAFFPDAPRRADDPLDPDLDAELVLARLGGVLSLRDAGGDTLVFGAPEPTGHAGFGNRELTVRGPDGARRQMQLASTVDFDGTCVISIDGQEVYRGTQWGRLSVLAHVKAGAGELGRGNGGVTAYYGDELTYLEHEPLIGVARALAPDLERARPMVATALGVSAEAFGDRLSAPSTVLPHVEVEGALAPFTIVASGNVSPPIPFLFAPVIAMPLDQHARWMPASGTVTHTLRVTLPRPALTVAGYGERPDQPLVLEVGIELARSGSEQVAVRVTSASAPRPVPGGLARTGACVQQVAEVALAYVRAPDWGPTPRAPSALAVNNFPTVSTAWLTVPCAVWGGDLVETLRARPQLIGALLDRTSYASANPTASVSVWPNGWELVLADVAPGADPLDALERTLATRRAVVLGTRTVRRVLATGTYASADDQDRRSLRALGWYTGLLCGAELTDVQVGQLLAAADDGDYDDLRDRISQCPF